MAQQLKIDIVAKDKSKQALTGVRGSLTRLKNLYLVYKMLLLV